MRLTTRLAVVITFLLVLFFAGTLVFQRYISKNILNLGIDRIGQSQTEIQSLLKIHGRFIQSYVYDNSSWDEMVQFVEKPNTKWFIENVQTPSQKLQIDYLWVFDAKGQLVHANSNNESSTLLFNPEALGKQFSWKDSKNYPHFFTKINNRIVEVFIAPIQSSADQERHTEAKGFLAAGQIYDSEMFGFFKEYMPNTSFQIVDQNNNNEFKRKEGTVYVYHPLIGDTKTNIAYLKVEQNLPLYKLFTRYQALYNYFFIGFSLSILLLLIFFIIKYVNSPLHLIFDAISLRSEEPILQVKDRNDEFGQLSSLISLFFKQRKQLFEEIEERKKSEESLRKALHEVEITTLEKIKAERADEAKSVFISNISHELRTPMNAVVAISELLIKDKPSEEEEKLLKVLHFSAKQLTNLVTDILDFSKIESNNLDLEQRPFNLYHLCDELAQMMIFSSHQKSVHLFFKEDETLKNLLVGDAHRLNQVLINLLSNAIKFTDKGEINFIYKVLHLSEDQKAQIYFEVNDTGMGISKEDLPHIFERFYQAHSNMEKKLVGTGLGLALSYKLVDLMGGRLKAESELGKGTRFYFTLQFDLDPALAEGQKKASLQNVGNALSGLKVLVAEDHEINAFVLKQFFTQWKVQAVYAENGKIALERLEEQEFDLVLMDLQMPVMDGYEAVQQIRSWPKSKFKRLPIVAVTANASKETREHLLQNGFDIFVSKPFDSGTLYQVLFTIKKHTLETKPENL